MPYGQTVWWDGQTLPRRATTVMQPSQPASKHAPGRTLGQRNSKDHRAAKRRIQKTSRKANR